MKGNKAQTQCWPADKVERRAVSSLIPYARNARTHSQEQIGQLAASMMEWGFTNPVLVDEQGGIIAGHGRVLAAQSLGLNDVPVMVAVGWTEAQRRAYIIADNKLALNAEWNDDLLKIEFDDLELDGFNLELTGFGIDEMANIFGTIPEADRESSTKEIDPDDYKMGCKCPKCGFEFDDK